MMLKTEISPYLQDIFPNLSQLELTMKFRRTVGYGAG